jgi:hypothetical protein
MAESTVDQWVTRTTGAPTHDVGRGCRGGVLTVVQAAAERWRDDDEERRRLELSTRAGEGERERARERRTRLCGR